MTLKFWHREQTGGGPSETAGVKLPKPRDLPQQIGMYLVVHEQLDPDWVWALKCVVRPRPDRKRYFECRVCEPMEAKKAKIEIVNYTSLDAYPELILFKGKYDKDVRDPELDRTPPMPKAA